MENYDEINNLINYLNDIGKDNGIKKPYNQCLKKQNEFKKVLKEKFSKKILIRMFCRLDVSNEHLYRSLTALSIYFASIGTFASIFSKLNLRFSIFVGILMLLALILIIHFYFKDSRAKYGYKIIVKECIEEIEQVEKIKGEELKTKEKKIREKIKIQKALRKSSF
ncbi:hypothetical protein [Sporolactobacillus laevolacticus]|uniref:Uncharacterized protein n=1 Tax=Sporolactobacillus laevolacticus DSM 442 TaxID=1395513 RepID=V6IZH4_9BACL|nr:hypothetical protein [Sporolactobacillus laevolacticus]EST12216.1 hypothetical protein P343_07870 [Sporolactobacillus laevolacticus DSM 442]